MTTDGILMKPRITKQEQQVFDDLLAKVKKDKERRRRLHGNLDTAALVRAARGLEE